ncbi:phage holin family protein [Roseovarius sp. SCSIO 43702]|uniref:phage holin family protein n=1 Tax=Roseovarius sp. SCSIO 43702 TaxID=2823043 RepID=UPI001C731D0E|nr:phage holin family protein [Roseovarius sp. SCSIO 43702]QYX58285.1 phage holin family protein [Roseovarius sp. SCSIO 43702]
MSDPTHNKSTTEILSDALNHVSALVRKEVDLARAEISENLNKAGVAVGLIAGALIVALVSLNVLAAALVAALTNAGLDAGWSSLIVGVVLAVIALVMVGKGLNDLKLSSLAPTRTTENIKRDAQAVKESYNDK